MRTRSTPTRRGPRDLGSRRRPHFLAERSASPSPHSAFLAMTLRTCPGRRSGRRASLTSQACSHASPRANLLTHVERFIQSVRDEFLHRFNMTGTQHLDYLVTEYVDRNMTDRPHMGIDQRVPTASQRTRQKLVREVQLVDHVRCRTRLGGVFKTHQRIAA